MLQASHILFLEKKKPICLITYLFTPWSRVVLEKLTGSQLVKKFPAFYGLEHTNSIG